MTFRLQLAAYVLGNVTASDLPGVSLVGLQEGFDSPSLCILAGMNANDYSSEIEHYFNAALRELDLELPSKRQAVLEIAAYLLDELFTNKKDIMQGVTLLVRHLSNYTDFFPENQQYAFDGMGFEHVYGLYDTHSELSCSDHPWQEGKTNAELLVEVEQRLLVALKDWENNFLRQATR